MKVLNIAGYELMLFDDKSVGVIISGGADSSLLLYILMTHIKDHLHIYNILEPLRQPLFEPSIDASIEFCAKATGKTNYTMHKIYESDASPETIFTKIAERLDGGEIDIVYTGITNFPPYEVWKEFDPDQWHIDLRSEDNIKPLFGITIPIKEDTEFSSLTTGGVHKDAVTADERFYSPWINLNKKAIAAMYEELDLVDSLFPITRSCEDEENFGDNCGKCMWCVERIWAFGKL